MQLRPGAFQCVLHQVVGSSPVADERASVAPQPRDQVNQALGFVQLYPSFSSVSMRKIWILNDLYVATNARRYGVGRLLMDRARDFARDTGALRLELTTARTNAAAQLKPNYFRHPAWRGRVGLL